MSPGTVLLVGIPLVAALTGVAFILLRFLLALPRWRTVHLPGFTFKVSGNVDDAKVADALLIAIECLAPIYERDAILTAIEVAHLRILVMDSESWLNVVGERVGGEQVKGQLWVNHSLSSLAHELVHFLQWALEERVDSTHATWGARVWQADEAYRAAIK